VRPVLNLYGSWQDSNQQKQELAQLKHENERLRTQAESLDSGGVAERAARTQGYYRTGEKPFSINGL
jgi:cell division protein FtsB